MILAALLGLLLQASPPPPPSPAMAPPAAGDDYQVGANDILRVTVYGHDDLTQTVVVQADGRFVFPLIGHVQAAGWTPKDLANKIAVLLARGFVRSPQVTVVVLEYRSQSVFVVGEVARPGIYPLSGAMSVMEMLSRAGPTAGAGTEVVIVRPHRPVDRPVLPADVAAAAGAPLAEVIRVNLREIQMGHLDRNLVLRPHDTVFVTQAARIFVTGEVRNAGAFAFAPGLTVRQAISVAGGLTPDGSSGRLRVIREVDGRAKELKARLDDEVLPGDTIVVKAKLF
jgi:polysaccharide export outer membrane protein